MVRRPGCGDRAAELRKHPGQSSIAVTVWAAGDFAVISRQLGIGKQPPDSRGRITNGIGREPQAGRAAALEGRGYGHGRIVHK
jgi:hypothetical protein